MLINEHTTWYLWWFRWNLLQAKTRNQSFPFDSRIHIKSAILNMVNCRKTMTISITYALHSFGCHFETKNQLANWSAHIRHGETMEICVFVIIFNVIEFFLTITRYLTQKKCTFFNISITVNKTRMRNRLSTSSWYGFVWPNFDRTSNLNLAKSKCSQFWKRKSQKFQRWK